jgi:hypothetical protein
MLFLVNLNLCRRFVLFHLFVYSFYWHSNLGIYFNSYFALILLNTTEVLKGSLFYSYFFNLSLVYDLASKGVALYFHYFNLSLVYNLASKRIGSYFHYHCLAFCDFTGKCIIIHYCVGPVGELY